MNFLVLLPFWAYTAKMLSTMEEVYTDGNICYVSLNKPYRILKPLLEEGNLHPERFRVIDAVTRSVMHLSTPERNCIFVSSPNAFDELQQRIVETLAKDKCRLLVFDSIYSLLIYLKEEPALAYLKKISDTAEMFRCEALFTVLKENLDDSLVKRLGLIMDKTVDMTRE